MRAIENDILNDQERLELMDIIVSIAKVDSPMALIECASGPLQRFLPHQSLLCAIGSIVPGNVQIHEALSNNFPVAYLHEMMRDDGCITTHVLASWYITREPQIFDAVCDADKVDPAWLERFNRYKLINLLAHGIADVQGLVSSYVGLYRIPEKINRRHVYLMKLLVPHFHVALLRVMADKEKNLIPNPPLDGVLSEQQKIIFGWMQRGKTNWEVSQILDMTEANVKYHVKQILRKLGATNRIQAVSKSVGPKIAQFGFNQ